MMQCSICRKPIEMGQATATSPDLHRGESYGYVVHTACLDKTSKERSLLDSPEWSRKFDILSFSRLTLSTLGFTTEQITSLTDEEMQAIADSVQEEFANNGFFLAVKFHARDVLAEKG